MSEDTSNIVEFELGRQDSLSGTVFVDPPCEQVGMPHEERMLQAAPDLIKSPSHYNRNGVETWDIIEHVIAEYPDPVAAYHVASMHKYADRAPYKGDFWQNIRKLIEHAKRLEKYADRLGR